MENYSPVIAKSTDNKGFIVECVNTWPRNIYYVSKGKLLIGTTNIYFAEYYHILESQWYWQKIYRWGVLRSQILIRKIDEVVIKEVSEIPKWVFKTYDQVLEEFKVFDKKRYEDSLRGRLIAWFKREKK